MDPRPSSTQPRVGEPRENRGRLRHCKGLQTPTATGLLKSGIGKAGARFQAPSQDTGLAVLVTAGEVDSGELIVDGPKTQQRVFHQQ